MEGKVPPVPEVRVDKWLWAVRLFKTRSLSAEACRKGRVLVGDVAAKPSRMLREGDIINLRRPPSTFTFRVLRLVDKRQPAGLVAGFLEDITATGEKDKSMQKNILVFAVRPRGSGRPTKRERREMDKLNDQSPDS
jgi:ribosome-associated heat shock protein Hsp15